MSGEERARGWTAPRSAAAHRGRGLRCPPAARQAGRGPDSPVARTTNFSLFSKPRRSSRARMRALKSGSARSASPMARPQRGRAGQAMESDSMRSHSTRSLTPPACSGGETKRWRRRREEGGMVEGGMVGGGTSARQAVQDGSATQVAAGRQQVKWTECRCCPRRVQNEVQGASPGAWPQANEIPSFSIVRVWSDGTDKSGGHHEPGPDSMRQHMRQLPPAATARAASARASAAMQAACKCSVRL